MKYLSIGVMLCLCFAASGFSQQSAASAPATRQDVEAYFQAMHTQHMEASMMQAVVGPIRQMMHEVYVKNKLKCDLPPDFEAKMENLLSASMKDMPFDQMIQAMVPVYQKDFTAAELHALTAFYSGPMGQDILRKLPVATADSMRAMMPIMERQQMVLEQEMKKDIAQTLKESKLKSCPATAGM